MPLIILRQCLCFTKNCWKINIVNNNKYSTVCYYIQCDYLTTHYVFSPRPELAENMQDSDLKTHTLTHFRSIKPTSSVACLCCGRKGREDGCFQSPPTWHPAPLVRRWRCRWRPNDAVELQKPPCRSPTDVSPEREGGREIEGGGDGLCDLMWGNEPASEWVERPRETGAERVRGGGGGASA